ncbi:MAG: hypothetical protein K6360_05400 [Deltaproteobacteria bacterium]
MSTQSRSRPALFLLAAFFFVPLLLGFIAGCSPKTHALPEKTTQTAKAGKAEGSQPSKDMGEEKLKEEEQKKALEERVVASPMLITSDYFRETAGEGKSIKLFGDSKKEKELEERLARLEERLMGLPHRAKDAKGMPVLRRKVVLLSLLGDLGIDVLSLLPSAMRRTDGMVPVDASQLENLLNDRGLTAMDLASASVRREIAASVGIQAYVLVSIPQNQILAQGESPNIRLDLVHATESVLIGSYITPIDRFDATAQRMSDDVVRGTEWSCRVVKIEGGKVYLNAGRLTGLQPGDHLRVYGKGRELVDPLTGRSLGFAPGEIKGEIVINDLFGTDASQGEVLEEKIPIRPGDVVKMSHLA